MTICRRVGFASILVIMAVSLFVVAGTESISAGAREQAQMVPAKDLDWTDAVVQVAIAWGDEAIGPYGKFVRFKPHFVSPPHYHTNDYNAAVISGMMSNPVDDAAGLGAGSYYFMPGGQPHVTKCLSDTPCEIYVHQDEGFDFVRVE